MQANPYAPTDSVWSLDVSPRARVVVFLLLTVVVVIQLYAGWQGVQVSDQARVLTGTPAGEVTGAYRSEVNQIDYQADPALRAFTWVIGISGAFSIPLIAYFLSSLTLIGAPSKGWARRPCWRPGS